MTELILGLAGALTGSGVTAIALAILQRRWQQKDKLDEIQKQLQSHCQADDERYVKQCRTRILRFNDEVIRGIHHTKEHFDDVLDDITEYTRYCDTHKDFKNEKAVMAIANVKRVYAHCEETNSFLDGEEKEEKNMSKFSYLNYLHEITKLAVEMPTNFSEAWDRFRADVKSGKANAYNTGDVLKDFDFAAAGQKWDAMTEAEQTKAIEEWQAFMCDENGVYKRDLTLALVNAYNSGKE